MDGNSEFSWVTGGDEDYKCEGLVARGGHGNIYKVIHYSKNRTVARKLVHHPQEDIQNELHFVQKLCSQGHVHIVEVFAINKLPDGRYFIDMELCERTLAEFIKKCWEDKDSDWVKQFRIRDVWSITGELADGLAFIDKNNAIHRDLKPQNVLFSGRDGKWKLTDFGITSSGSHDPVTTQKARGTDGYRAPELVPMGFEPNLKLTVSSAVDIWALGCICFELTRGDRCFSSDYSTYLHYADNEFKDMTCEESSSEHDVLIAEAVGEMTQKQPVSRPSAKQVRLLCQVAISSSSNPTVPVCPPSIETRDVSVQTDNIKNIVTANPDANWRVCHATFCPANNCCILMGRWNRSDTYQVELWNFESNVETPLIKRTQKLSKYTLAVVPGFGPNGRHFVVYSDAHQLEVFALDNLKSRSFKLQLHFRIPISAIAVDNSGTKIAYSFKSPWHCELNQTVEKSACGDVEVTAICAAYWSDISLAYDSHREYLWAFGTRRFQVQASVWDLAKECQERLLKLPPGEFPEFPVGSLLFGKPLLSILSSDPDPRDHDVRTKLPIYSPKGVHLFTFGAEWLICSSFSNGKMFILTKGPLFNVDLKDAYLDPPEFLEEYELLHKWLHIDSDASEEDKHIWSWDGSANEPKWRGLISENALRHDEWVAFGRRDKVITLITEDGSIVPSELLTPAGVSSQSLPKRIHSV